MADEQIDERTVKQIESCRQMDPSRSKVTYDLSSIDFSQGKVIAYALAKTIWEKDLKECWTEDNGIMQFHSKYDIEITLPQNFHHHAKKITSEVQKDLEEVDMWGDLESYCYDHIQEFEPSLEDFYMYGLRLTDFMAQRADKKSALKELANLYTEMSSHITIIK